MRYLSGRIYSAVRITLWRSYNCSVNLTDLVTIEAGAGAPPPKFGPETTASPPGRRF